MTDHTHALRTMQIADWIMPVVFAAVFVVLMSFLREPTRRRFNAIFVAGAGAAYLNYGGFGVWEFPFTALATWAAYRGLDDYRFTGIAWLMHAVWDVAHHLWGNPIMPIQATSSAGCAIMDALIAIWFLRGAPSVIPGRDVATAAPSPARWTGAAHGRPAVREAQLCVMLRSTIWRMPPWRR